jgi:hypothetical protein
MNQYFKTDIYQEDRVICKCGKPMLSIKDYAYKSECRTCYNKRMAKYRDDNREKINRYTAEYRKSKRWLDGAERTDDMGNDIGATLWNREDGLQIRMDGERIA